MLHPVGCLCYYISDSRSKNYQIPCVILATSVNIKRPVCITSRSRTKMFLWKCNILRENKPINIIIQRGNFIFFSCSNSDERISQKMQSHCPSVRTKSGIQSGLKKMINVTIWKIVWRNKLTFWSLLVTRCTKKFNIQELYALPTLHLSVFICEQTATCATYSKNWLVFIIEMKSVYSAVRTGSLNKAVCASSLKGLSENKQRLVPLTA